MVVPRIFLFLVWAILAGLPSWALGETLRIVSYNIAADIDGRTTARPGLTTVLEAIGQQNMNGIMQPLDILALQETTRNTTTIAPIVFDLNTYYGAGTYAVSSYQGLTSRNNPSGGNGPNGLIYNTTTLQLISSVGISPASGATNGVYRQVVRYQFEPVGGTSANDFYVYVSHMKSNFGVAAEVQAARNGEAMIIRQDAGLLPLDASILYLGDFNFVGAYEDAYKTMLAPGPGKAVDPLNLAENTSTSVKWSLKAYKDIMTQASTGIQGRDDIQFMTQNVYDGTAPSGLQYVPESYRAFGNNGTTALGKSVNLTTNTALNNLQGDITVANALSALTTASDHLPVVVDYFITVPEPGTLVLLGIGGGFIGWIVLRRKSLGQISR